jgi:tripartite-type tricarboxylate transporter receptor subunit TctC
MLESEIRQASAVHVRRGPWHAMIIAAVLIFCAHGETSGQEFPLKPVRVVPVGGSDPLLRLLTPKIAEGWGQQVIIDDRPGAAGLIAGNHVVRAPPDGYTLLIATTTFVITPNFYKFPFEVTRDFVPISLLAQTPFLLVSHPALPARTLAELVKLAKARPGELTFSAASPGSPAAMVGELFKLTAGVNLLHVPYKTLPAALIDVIAGQVQLGFTVAPIAIPHAQTKRLRMLAIASSKRSAVAPETPTFSELGYPNVVATGWYALIAPATTPAPIVNRINGAFVKALKLPDVHQRVLTLGMDSVGSTPAECGEHLRAEQVKWAKFIKDANIKIDTSLGL